MNSVRLLRRTVLQISIPEHKYFFVFCSRRITLPPSRWLDLFGQPWIYVPIVNMAQNCLAKIVPWNEFTVLSKAYCSYSSNDAFHKWLTLIHKNASSCRAEANLNYYVFAIIFFPLGLAHWETRVKHPVCIFHQI